MRVGRCFWQNDEEEVEEGNEMIHILDLFVARYYRIMMVYTEAYLCPCNASFCSVLVEVDERNVFNWRNTFGVGGRELSSHR